MSADAAALSAWIDQATRSLFRLETLDRYDVDSDGGDYERYISGEDGPDLGRKAAWHRVLRADMSRGLTTRRVHVVRSPLSDYLRYEFEWGYAWNQDYEEIRILDLAEVPAPAELAGLGDFWLVDGERAAAMCYDMDGRYLGFEPAGDIARYQAAADAAWNAAEPFAAYWDTHRQFWRSARQAA